MRYVVLWQLFAGWNGSESTGSLKVILGEPTLQTFSIQSCPGHQGGGIGGIDPNDSGEIFNRLFRLIQLEVDLAPQCIGLLLVGDPAFRGLGSEEFFERGQRLMPGLVVRLTAGLRRIRADKALASDISERIELKGLLVGSGGRVQLFQPGEHVPFPDPCPYVLAVERDGAIEVCSGFVQIVRVIQGLSLLGKGE